MSRHKQDVHKRKIFRSETQNIMRFEDTQIVLRVNSPSTDCRIVLHVNTRNAKNNYFVFRTFTRDTIRTSLNGRGVGGVSSKRMKLDKDGGGGPESQFLVGRL